jgi:hypothetical protein
MRRISKKRKAKKRKPFLSRLARALSAIGQKLARKLSTAFRQPQALNPLPALF